MLSWKENHWDEIQHPTPVSHGGPIKTLRCFRIMSYHDDNNGYDRYDGYVVRIRGLPWSASQEEVANFLSGNIAQFSYCKWLKLNHNTVTCVMVKLTEQSNIPEPDLLVI